MLLKASQSQTDGLGGIRIAITESQPTDGFPQVKINVAAYIGVVGLDDKSEISITIDPLGKTKDSIAHTEEIALVSSILHKMKNLPNGDTYLAKLKSISVHQKAIRSNSPDNHPIAIFERNYGSESIAILSTCEGKIPLQVLLDLGNSDYVTEQDELELTDQLTALHNLLPATPIILTIAHNSACDPSLLDIPFDDDGIKTVFTNTLTHRGDGRTFMGESRVQSCDVILAVGELTDFGKEMYGKNFRSEDRKNLIKPFLHIIDGSLTQPSLKAHKLLETVLDAFKVRDSVYGNIAGSSFTLDTAKKRLRP
jgi:hypothetical protein